MTSNLLASGDRPGPARHGPKLRSPPKWHGGKSYLARRIIALMPPHRIYVEPFLGGGSVLLNKLPSSIEIVGDVHFDLIRFWRALRDHPEVMADRLRAISYCEKEFLAAKDRIASTGGTEVDFLVANRMSRGGLGKDFAWSDRLRGKRRIGGPVPGDVNAWDTFRESIPSIARRIRDVHFKNFNAIRWIEEIDDKDTLIYCDPPYLPATRTHRRAYAHEMTADEHKQLLAVIVASRANIMISGYRCPMYDNLLKSWTRHEFDMPNHSGQGKSKQRRTECLWIKRANP